MAHFSMANRFNTYSKPTSPPRGRSRVGKKPTRIRTAFSDTQLLALEARYKEQKYLNKEERGGMAMAFGLGDKQIKIWFQNRRMKEKKEKLDASAVSPLSADTSEINRSPDIDFSKVAPPHFQQKLFKVEAQQDPQEFQPAEFPDLVDEQEFTMMMGSEYLLPENVDQCPAPDYQWQWNYPHNPYDGQFQHYLENCAYQQMNYAATNYGNAVPTRNWCDSANYVSY